jgi:hypothetical protein
MRLIITIAAIVSALTCGLAQERKEFSPDGLDSIAWTPSAQDAARSFARDSVPYVLTPNWNCTLRMQVGGIDIGDMNNDGHPDVAVACYKSQSYPPYPDWRKFILYNTGTQLQSSPGWWSRDSTSATEVRIADFNNDGHPDLFGANGDGSFPRDAVYFGGAGDTLAHVPGWYANTSTWTTGAAVCDFDHDGDIDVATSNQGVAPNAYRPVTLFRNNNGVLETNPSWQSAASEISSAIAWADVDHDGFEDLGVSKWVNFQSCFYRNVNGTLQTTPAWTGNTTGGQKGVAFADMNGDTLPDIALGGSIPTQVYLNTGGTFAANPVWSSVNAYHGTQDIAWADVDEDGDPDLATAEFSTGQFRIYLNRNGVLDASPTWQYDSPEAGTALGFGDINGDGHVDFVIGVSGQPAISVFYNRLTTSVADQEQPAGFVLEQNFPNPFNPSTTIRYTLKRPAMVTMTVHTLLGQEVARLVDGQKSAGVHAVQLAGEGLGSGVYFCRMTAGGFTSTKKLLLLR